MNRNEAWGESKIIPIAGCFIFNDSGQLLMLKRHHDTFGGGRWAVPAGRVEAGEDDLRAMTREIFEETGLKLSDIHYLGEHLIKMPHGTVSMSSFTANIETGTPVTLKPDEHEDFAWIDPQNVLTTKQIVWGEPTLLRDFGYIEPFDTDPTLVDGSIVTLLNKA